MACNVESADNEFSDAHALVYLIFSVSVVTRW